MTQNELFVLANVIEMPRFLAESLKGIPTTPIEFPWDKPDQLKREIENLAPILFVVALVNFATFWVVAIFLGGDAINGKMENDHYYLANQGELTEVSRTVWLYSFWHTTSVFVTQSLHNMVERDAES